MIQKIVYVVTVIAIVSSFIGWSCANGTSERTVILLKPETVQRALVGRIIQRFEDKGFKLVAMKLIRPTKELLEEHYADLKGEVYYTRMIQYLADGPIISMVWEGLNATAISRQMINVASTGSIRDNFIMSIERTVVHGSDSVKAANREINLWFQDNEIVSWTPSNSEWIYGPSIN